MRLIKLDAIDSTNEFLKGLASQQSVENFTVVVAENQTRGKGQMGAVWTSESGKNLTMSVLVKDFTNDVNQMFQLNRIVSVALIEALEVFNVPKLSIKWPNDIMSASKKIGGILIENTIKSDGSIFSVVGLGLNVNQMHFENLPKASSMALECNTSFDKERLLEKVVLAIENKIQYNVGSEAAIQQDYQRLLFKKGVPMTFEDEKGLQFSGIIQGVSTSGKIQILQENDHLAEFGIKEFQMLY